ncbi:Ig-like domain-containing protein [Nocardia spumae]|uniref:Ig-like domain-containing protein n=1 Tax=Nocardia spumae TaxID=2887190 RepID=UPI001D14DDF8|nr:Ig-like domain-containing protein [Nocardia spumae]
MTDFASDFRQGNADLELAALDWAIGLAPKSVPLPTSFSNSSSVIQPLTGFLPVGNLDKKGAVKIANAITSTPVDTYGEQGPTRIIVKSREITVDWTMQQTSAITLSAFWGQDFTGEVADPDSGEVNLIISESSQNLEWRLVMIARDGADGDEKYTIIAGPRVTLQKSGDIQTNDDGIQMYPVTMQFLKDDSYGYAARIAYAGPGWKTLTAAAGFQDAPSAINVSPSAATLIAAEVLQLTVIDNNGVNRTSDCTFSSGTPAKATVNSAGLVTAVATGTSTITASYTPPGGGSAMTDTCAVTVS